jgi:hypothetical protein
VSKAGSTFIEQNIDKAISIVYDRLETNFKQGYKLLTEYKQDSEFFNQLKARLNVVYGSIIVLKKISEEEDISQKAQRFCGLVEMLEETKNQDLRDLELSTNFLKNIDCKMGEA